MAKNKNDLMTEGFYHEFLTLVNEAKDVKKRKNDAKGMISHGYTFKVRNMEAEFYVNICSICPHPTRPAIQRKKSREIIREAKPAFLTATPSVNFLVNGHIIWYELLHENDEREHFEEIVTEILLTLEKKEEQEGVDSKTSTLKALGLL